MQTLSVPFRLSIIRNEGHLHIYDISLVVLVAGVAVVGVAVAGVAVLYTQSSLLNINKNLHSRLTSLRLGLLDSTKLNVSWTPGRAVQNLAPNERVICPECALCFVGIKLAP